MVEFHQGELNLSGEGNEEDPMQYLPKFISRGKIIEALGVLGINPDTVVGVQLRADSVVLHVPNGDMVNEVLVLITKEEK